MLSASMRSLGTTSVLARTCGVRALTVVRPVVGQLIRKSCYSTYASTVNQNADVFIPKAKGRVQHGTTPKPSQGMEEAKRLLEKIGPLHILINRELYKGMQGYRRLCHLALEWLYQHLILEVTSSTAIAYNAKGTSEDGKAPAIGKNAKNRNWLPFWRWIIGLPEKFRVPCSVVGCNEEATCGGHMMLQASPGGCCIKYSAIAPVCGDHNNYLKTPSDKPLNLKVGARLLWLPPHWAWAFDMFLPEDHQSDPEVETPLGDSLTGGSAANGVHGMVPQGQAIVAAVYARADVGRSFTVSDSARQQALLYQAAMNSHLSHGPRVVESAGFKFLHVEKLLHQWGDFRTLMTAVRS